jgi:hypothetical protein
MGKIFKATKEQKEMARKRLESRERERGSDEEYYAELLKTYINFEDIRKKVNDKSI